jgi:hypothetical protein
MMSIVNVFAKQPFIVRIAALALAPFSNTAHIRNDCICFMLKRWPRQVASEGGFVEHLSWT